jgi:hypothetical protein
MTGGGLLRALTGMVAIATLAASASAAAADVRAGIECDPLALASPAAPTAARVSGTAAEAGVVEPNVEAVYEQVLDQRRGRASGVARPSAGGRATGNAEVPVYVHVIQENATTGAVPAQRIADQIAVLNSSFAGTTGGNATGISFRLIDTDVTINPDWYPLIVDSAQEAAAKTALREGGARALNLYIVDAGELLGWATFPQQYPGGPATDGVVVETTSLPGNAPPYGQGDTATHEVGHWLGLFHTFQGGCTPPGDLIADTPAEATSHFGCPTVDSCPDPGNDPVDNFMSYADDACMHRFTPLQGDRMHELTAQFRNAAPAAARKTISTAAGRPVTVDVGASDPDGDALTYAVADPPRHGTLAGARPSLTYRPRDGYAGPDSFTVRATDVFGATGATTVDVTVVGVNLFTKAKRRQKLSRLAIRGTCGAQACRLEVRGKIVATAPAGRKAGARKAFKIKRASARVEANESAKLRLRLARPKQRKLLALLDRGWKATAKASITGTDATGDKATEKASILIKP